MTEESEDRGYEPYDFIGARAEQNFFARKKATRKQATIKAQGNTPRDSRSALQKKAESKRGNPHAHNYPCKKPCSKCDYWQDCRGKEKA